MSFYTSLKFYRPTKPPKVTGRSLAHFLREFANADLLKEDSLCNVELKFGSAIDQDDEGTSWTEPILETEGAVVSEWHQIDWDVQKQAKSILELARQIETYEETIYRAFVMLGCARESITNVLTREPTRENDAAVCLWDWNISLGPVEIAALGSENVFHAGWISVSISGNGYLFPWTFADLFQRAESQPDLQRLKELCRRTWPVVEVLPDAKRREGRKQMGELWPYPIDQAVDWCWGLAESG